MPLNPIADGSSVPVTLAAPITSGDLYALNECVGVALNSGVSGDVVPIALEGVFTVSKKAHADPWAVGEKVYGLTTGGVVRAIAAATGAAIALGHAFEAATTGATTGKVRLSQF